MMTKSKQPAAAPAAAAPVAVPISQAIYDAFRDGKAKPRRPVGQIGAAELADLLAPVTVAGKGA
jgi:hypothetical protein